MRVEMIETLPAFLVLEEAWNAVYDSDPQSQFFLSFPWMASTFARHEHWRVLAVRYDGDGPFIAFMPLRRLAVFNPKRGEFQNEIQLAGTWTWADYNGLLCHPEHESAAIPALAEGLKKLHWSRIDLRHLYLSDHRLELFTKGFDDQTFIIESGDDSVQSDGTNNSVCPVVDLPADYETYLTQSISANMRQKLRRLVRTLEATPELRVVESDARTFDRDADALIGFWKKTWADRKGRKLDRLARKYRAILQQAHEAGVLYMPVLFKGDARVGVIACFMDERKKAMLYFVAGREETFEQPSPGLILHAHAIRWAIEHGFKTYDFLRGDERFKYSFGGKDRTIRNMVIRTRSGANLHGMLDPDLIGAVLSQADTLEDEGSVKAAAAAFRQVVAQVPNHDEALREGARVLYRVQDYAASEQMCLALLDRKPQDASTWRQLGKTRLAWERFVEAEDALKRANVIQPTVSGYYMLSRALLGLGRDIDAVAVMEQLLRVKPRGSRERKQREDARRELDEYMKLIGGEGGDVEF